MRRLDAIEATLAQILKNQETTLSALSDLQSAVAAEDTVVASALTLIQGFAAALAAAGTDPVALAALTTDINTQAQGLAAAVAQNTPAPVVAAPGAPAATAAAPVAKPLGS